MVPIAMVREDAGAVLMFGCFALVIGLLVGTLIGAVILRAAVKWVLKFDLAFGAACGTASILSILHIHVPCSIRPPPTAPPAPHPPGYSLPACR